MPQSQKPSSTRSAARQEQFLEVITRDEATARFQRHFGQDKRVCAPSVLPEFTRRRVLVTEWIRGDKVDRLQARFASGELNFTKLMKTLTEIYLRMLLVERS